MTPLCRHIRKEAVASRPMKGGSELSLTEEARHLLPSVRPSRSIYLSMPCSTLPALPLVLSLSLFHMWAAHVLITECPRRSIRGGCATSLAHADTARKAFSDLRRADGRNDGHSQDSRPLTHRDGRLRSQAVATLLSLAHALCIFQRPNNTCTVRIRKMVPSSLMHHVYAEAWLARAQVSPA